MVINGSKVVVIRKRTARGRPSSLVAEWKWLSIFLLNINTKGELVYEMESR